MKKMMMSLILALMPTLVPSCLFAADFVEIYRDSNYLVYLDTSSIQDQGTYYKAWARIVYSGKAAKIENDRYKKEVDHILSLEGYSKTTKQICSLAVYVYGMDGLLISSSNYENNSLSWQTVVPETIGEAKIEAVYSYAGD